MDEAPAPSSTGSSTCSTGTVSCCNSYTTSDSPEAVGLLSQLGVVLEGVTTGVGLSCSPINVRKKITYIAIHLIVIMSYRCLDSVMDLSGKSMKSDF